MSIFHRGLFGTRLGFGYDVDFETRNKLEVQKRLESGNMIKKLTSQIEERGELCTLAEVKGIIDRSDNQDVCSGYIANDFTEEMSVTIDNTEFNLKIGLFPKNKRDAGINISIADESIHTTLSSHSKPESVVQFMTELAAWMPEYRMIETKWREEIKKIELACDIAFDVLKRNAEQKLEEKGYDFRIENTHYQYQARIYIRLPEGVEITFRISLLEDFLGEVTKIIDSLPSRK